MFYRIQRLKKVLQSYLTERKPNLTEEASKYSSIEEAYRAGFIGGFWEGAGETGNVFLQKSAG